MSDSRTQLPVEQVSFARLHMLMTYLCSWAEGCGMTRGRAELIAHEVLECLCQYTNADASQIVEGVHKIITIPDGEVMKAFRAAMEQQAARDGQIH